ncbi:MAG: putative acyl-CoA ligase [Acidimicrobiales bacterium]|nr:MAG: putative acyl-CoA ligase [Acidimicrobiales bacterium]
MANTDVTGFWKIAEADPDHLALIDPDYNEMTYGELAALTNKIVHGLRAAGLQRGDQVTTVLPNSFEQVAVCLAAFQGGFYVTTVNWHLVGPEISYIVNDSETKALIVSERFADEAERVLEDCVTPEANRFCVGDVKGFRPFADLIDGQSGERPDDLSPGSYMFYTSGTTGRPKGVRRGLPEGDVDETAAGSGMFLMLFGTMPHDDNVQITQAPTYHTAVNNWTTMSLHMGHTVVLMDRWTPEGLLERIERCKVTHSHMVPTMFNRLLQLPEEVRAKYDVSSLRRMVHAAAPCPVETKKKMIEWWGDSIWEYYAATEGGGTVVGPEDWMKKPGTVGAPWPGAEVICVDEDGNDVPTFESGTVYMKMPGNAFEYKGDKDKTEKSRLRGFFTVGDIGYLDDDGYLFLNDRANDMIIAGGVNIYPAEIEGAMVQHEAVGDVAVFGIPNEDMGEEIKAVVELREGWEPTEETTATIMDWLRGQVAKQKLPHSVDYTTEMPRDPNGKLYKRRLKDPYWEGREGNIV